MSAEDPRFDRLKLIQWWDQDKMAAAKVVVVGAGALGNEVLKNLALLGVGTLVVIDLDTIELSNLSRSVLFRAADAGQPKADVAFRAARDLYPGLQGRALNADVNHDVGLGLFAWADVVIGALDNREARLTINRHCYRVGTPWVDGAIEQVSGVARLFEPPEGPCYECTMSAADWKILSQRRSCSLLNREIIQRGHVPTTPTTASIVAGLMCQEAVKILHDQDGLRGSGFVFEGHGPSAYVAAYQRNPECLSHEPLPQPWIEVEGSSASLTFGDLLARGRAELGPEASLELVRELLERLECMQCGKHEAVRRPLSSLSEREGLCPECGARRSPVLYHSLKGGEGDLLEVPLAEVGLAPWDAVIVRKGEEEATLLLTGDRDAVLGGAS